MKQNIPNRELNNMPQDHRPLSRRTLLTSAAGVAASAAMLPATSAAANAKSPNGKATAKANFGYCFNTACIRGQIKDKKLDAAAQIDLTAKAGYQGIEPWMGHLHDYVKAGGSLKDLRKRLNDHGLTVESAIGFARWIVDDDAARQKGLEDAKRDMDLLAQIGAKRIAAPPAGATREGGLDLFKAAKRYRALLELGDKMGVIPMVEVWGFSKNLSRLGESMFVALEAGHPDACLLPDVYHIFKGGSDFEGLNLLAANTIQVFHMNDYPANPPRETISDKDRVYPGDGIAPLNDILGGLMANGSSTMLSLELFNHEYYKQDALVVAKTGLAKMKESVAKAEAVK